MQPRTILMVHFTDSLKPSLKSFIVLWLQKYGLSFEAYWSKETSLEESTAWAISQAFCSL